MGLRRILATDLDGTLIGHEPALRRFDDWLRTHRDDYYLVYATGRSLASVAALIESEHLPGPDAIVSDVGTRIWNAGGGAWSGWVEQLDGWAADRAREALRSVRWLELQDAAAQTEFKASYDVRGLTKADKRAIRRILRESGVEAAMVYSSGVHLDLIPPCAGKGVATRFLAEHWEVDARSVLAFGDSGNDADLLRHGFRGTLVANALPELRTIVGPDIYLSPQPFADGVLDGINYWTPLR
jgi:sucrose-6F-phosphate phosphohydrolase